MSDTFQNQQVNLDKQLHEQQQLIQAEKELYQRELEKNQKLIEELTKKGEVEFHNAAQSSLLEEQKQSLKKQTQELEKKQERINELEALNTTINNGLQMAALGEDISNAEQKEAFIKLQERAKELQRQLDIYQTQQSIPQIPTDLSEQINSLIQELQAVKEQQPKNQELYINAINEIQQLKPNNLSGQQLTNAIKDALQGINIPKNVETQINSIQEKVDKINVEDLTEQINALQTRLQQTQQPQTLDLSSITQQLEEIRTKLEQNAQSGKLDDLENQIQNIAETMPKQISAPSDSDGKPPPKYDAKTSTCSHHLDTKETKCTANYFNIAQPQKGGQHGGNEDLREKIVGILHTDLSQINDPQKLKELKRNAYALIKKHETKKLTTKAKAEADKTVAEAQTEANQKVAEAQQEKNDAEDKVNQEQQKTKQAEHAAQQAQTNLATIKNDYENKINHLNESIKNHQNEKVQEVQNELKQVKKDQESAKKDLEKAKRDLAQAKTDLAQSKQAETTAAETVKKVEAEAEAKVQHAKTQAEEQAAALQNQLDELTRSNEKLQSLQSSNTENSQKELNAKATEIKELNDRISEIQQTLGIQGATHVDRKEKLELLKKFVENVTNTTNSTEYVRFQNESIKNLNDKETQRRKAWETAIAITTEEEEGNNFNIKSFLAGTSVKYKDLEPDFSSSISEYYDYSKIKEISETIKTLLTFINGPYRYMFSIPFADETYKIVREFLTKMNKITDYDVAQMFFVYNGINNSIYGENLSDYNIECVDETKTVSTFLQIDPTLEIKIGEYKEIIHVYHILDIIHKIEEIKNSKMDSKTKMQYLWVLYSTMYNYHLKMKDNNFYTIISDSTNKYIVNEQAYTKATPEDSSSKTFEELIIQTNKRNNLEEYNEKLNSNRIVTIVKLNRYDENTCYNINRYRPYISRDQKSMFLGFNNNNQKYEYCNYSIEDSNFKWYSLGNFNKIYEPIQDATKDNSRFLNDKEVITDLLIKNNLMNNKPVFIMGYGSSGSGKTTSLIYNSKTKQNGILVEMCHKMHTLSDNTIDKIGVTIYELGVNINNNENNNEKVKQIDGNISRYETKYDFIWNDKSKTFTTVKDQKFNGLHVTSSPIKSENNVVQLGEAIRWLVTVDRNTKATMNNPESSRSHVLCAIDFNKDGCGKLILGDLAGVENVFNDSLYTLQQFSKKIKVDDIETSDYRSSDIDINDKFWEETEITFNEKITANVKTYLKTIDLKRGTNALKQVENVQTSVPKNLSEDINDYAYRLDGKPSGTISYNKEKWYETHNVTKGSKGDGVTYYQFKQDVKDHIIEHCNTFIKNLTFLDTITKTEIRDLKEEIEKFKFPFTQPVLAIGNTREMNDEDLILNKKNPFEPFNRKTNRIAREKHPYTNYKYNDRDFGEDNQKSIIKKLVNFAIRINRLINEVNNNAASSIEKKEKEIQEEKAKLTQYKNELKETYKDDLENEELAWLLAYSNGKRELYETQWTDIPEDLKLTVKDIQQVQQVNTYIQKLNYIKTKVIEPRRNEGLFINNELKALRDHILQCMIEKSGGNRFAVPVIAEQCTNTFLSESQKSFMIPGKNANDILNSHIMNCIDDITKKTRTEVYKELQITIFTLFNLNLSTDNPPTVPYIDINMYKEKQSIPEPTEIQKLLTYGQTAPEYSVLIEDKRWKRFMDNKTNDQNRFTDLVKAIDDHNATTTLGTLFFTDNMAKYGSTNKICYFDNNQKENFGNTDYLYENFFPYWPSHKYNFVTSGGRSRRSVRKRHKRRTRRVQAPRK